MLKHNVLGRALFYHGWNLIDHEKRRIIFITRSANHEKVVKLCIGVNQVAKTAFRCLARHLSSLWVLLSVNNLQTNIKALIVILFYVKLLVKEEYISIEPCVEHDLIRMLSLLLCSLNVVCFIFVTGYGVWGHERVRALNSKFCRVLKE